MGIFKRVIPKGVEGITFPDLTDGILYGVVNIETATLKISKNIPENDASAGAEFMIRTGEGDGDYPLFLFDEKEWFDDQNSLRPGWGAFISFHRNATESVLQELVMEDEKGEYLRCFNPVGYFPDKKFQFVAGKSITYVSDIDVEDRLYFSEATAIKGSGDVFVDIPLRKGRYQLFVIEDSLRDEELVEYLRQAHPEYEESEDYLVVSSLVIVHEDKIGMLNKKIYKKNPEKLREIETRLSGKDVEAKFTKGPVSYNAVYRNLWISIWSARYMHALSWNLQGLTFEKQFREVFTDAFIEANGKNSTTDQRKEAASLRGINIQDVHFPSDSS